MEVIQHNNRTTEQPLAMVAEYIIWLQRATNINNLCLQPLKHMLNTLWVESMHLDIVEYCTNMFRNQYEACHFLSQIYLDVEPAAFC